MTGSQTCSLPISLTLDHSSSPAAPLSGWPRVRAASHCLSRPSTAGRLVRRGPPGKLHSTRSPRRQPHERVLPSTRRTPPVPHGWRSEEHTSELQSLMRISYAVFCLKKKKTTTNLPHDHVTKHQ